MTVERVGKDFFADAPRFVVGQFLKPIAGESHRIHFDNESAPPRCVAVMMSVEIADPCLTKRLRQRLNGLGRAEPSKAVAHIIQACAEFIGMRAPHQ